ncbi:MAG: exonuclease SbcCD subunit D [Thermoplasmata archaeon]|nr:exonuclease SbcCD subunit D [Thermoplasmata archaeon]
MKVLQTSDMHLGKRVHEYSLAEDQRHILKEIVGAVAAEKPDALLIAGDVYDRAVPSEEAVTMFGNFLGEVNDLGCQIYVIAGNHDSGARLDYCGPLLGRSGIHIAGRFSGKAERIEAEDVYGKLNVWLLPYFKVSEVRAVSGLQIETYADAMAWVLEQSGVDPNERNILVAHQFFTAGKQPELSDSEDQRFEVGGMLDIPAGMLDAFDYVALGHLHIPQSVGRDTIRYCGSPLKYSASEARTSKSLTAVEIRGKGDVDVSTVPLNPLRDMRVVTGTLTEIVDAAPRSGPERQDYIFARLTEVPAGGVDEIYRAYPNTMSVEIVPREGSGIADELEMTVVETESAEELFSRFYAEMKGEELSRYQLELLRECIDLAGRDAE